MQAGQRTQIRSEGADDISVIRSFFNNHLVESGRERISTGDIKAQENPSAIYHQLSTKNRGSDELTIFSHSAKIRARWAKGFAEARACVCPLT